MIDKGTLFVLPKAVTITPSSVGGVTTAFNMLHDEKALVWRSTGKTGQYLVLNQCGAWDTLALIGINLAGSSTIRIRAADTLTGLTFGPEIDVEQSAYDGAPKATGGMILFRLDEAVTYPYVRIDFVNAVSPDAFIQVSNLVIGSAIEWEGVDVGAEVSYDNQASSYLRKFMTKPTWKITLSGITLSAFYEQWDGFFLAAGQRTGFLFVPVYNDDYQQKRSAFVSMVGSPKTTYNTANDMTIEMAVTTIQ